MFDEGWSKDLKECKDTELSHLLPQLILEFTKKKHLYLFVDLGQIICCEQNLDGLNTLLDCLSIYSLHNLTQIVAASCSFTVINATNKIPKKQA